ncbi:MAG: transposase [Bryobacterales bacterium]|nr:transposase [Bryobacterales bacterium]
MSALDLYRADVDEVRRKEQKILKEAGSDRLTGTRYDWLKSRAKMELEDRKEFDWVRKSGLKTSRAWALKETAMSLFPLNLRTSRQEALPVVAELGNTEPAQANDRSGRNAQAALRKHPHLSQASNHEYCQRIDQFQDPMGEVHSARIPQQAELHQCNLLPLRGAATRPVATKKPEAPPWEPFGARCSSRSGSCWID